MRKKFAEDDLLGKFRIKSNHTLRIDMKPTPPEQVEVVKKELELLMENPKTTDPMPSGLAIHWDTNDLDQPETLLTDEELKAILFQSPNEDQDTEEEDLINSHRHQKMLELLAKVEALNYPAEGKEDNAKVTLPDAPENATTHLSEQEAVQRDEEEARMRSEVGQFNTVENKQTDAESQSRAADSDTANEAGAEPFKLNVEHEDLQVRLIRILNENYSEKGEIRPQNLKSRLIEILNEEYSEDYCEELSAEDGEALSENPEVCDEEMLEMVTEDAFKAAPEDAFLDHSGIGSGESEVGSTASDALNESEVQDEIQIKRGREAFSHYQYVTSFQEVTGDASEEVMPSEHTDLPELETSAGLESDATLTQGRFDEPESDTEEAEEEEPAESGDEEEQSQDALHPWLKELRQGQYSEDEWPRVHLKKTGNSSWKQRTFGLGTEAATGSRPKTEATASDSHERSMSIEEWTFVFDTLKEQLEYLKKQLEIKDHQLQNKDELIRNFQILLKNEQDKFLKLEHKMEDVVLQVEERVTKKGFFSRFRKR